MGHGVWFSLFNCRHFQYGSIVLFLRRKILHQRPDIYRLLPVFPPRMGVAVYITAGFRNNFDMARKVNQLIQVVTGVGVFAFYMLLALLFKSEVALAGPFFLPFPL